MPTYNDHTYITNKENVDIMTTILENKTPTQNIAHEDKIKTNLNEKHFK